MSIEAFVTGGIGPGSTIGLFITRGLVAGAAIEATEANTGGYTRQYERETEQERRARIQAERENLGIIERQEKPVIEPPKVEIEVTASQAKQLKRLEAEQLRTIQILEAMAEHDTLKRRRVAMLLMLV